MIFLFSYFVPPIIVAIIILSIYHHREVHIVMGHVILLSFFIALGPIGFILSLLYIHDNFTKESLFN